MKARLSLFLLIVSLVLIAAMVILPQAALADTWSSCGPAGGSYTYALARDGSNNLYTGVMGGHVYRYDGSSWTDTGDVGPSWVFSLAWNGANMYAGTETGQVFRYDGDTTWTEVGNTNGSYVRELVWTGTYLYAGCYNGHVYRFDGGTAWTDTWPSSGGSPVESSLWNGTNVYVGADDGHVYRYDSGTTWTDMGYTGATIADSLAWNGTNVYAGTGNGHVSRCAAVGSWIDVGTAGTGNVQALGYFGNVLYAGSNNAHVYRYSGGTSWSDLGNTGGSSVYSLNWDSTSSTLYAGTLGVVYSDLITRNISLFAEEGGGSVAGGGAFPLNSSVTVHAIPISGCHFFGWWDPDAGTVSYDADYTFTVTRDRSLYASFGYDVTTQANPPAGGDTFGGGYAEYGQLTVVSALPHGGYHFVNWTKSGVPVSTAANYGFIPTSDCTLVANFATSPSVSTTAPSNITSTTADSGGNTITDGGASITHKGVCWSTSPNPTTSDPGTDDGTGTGDFSSSITGLTPGTAYHVRAYATNSVGTSYGSDLPFRTPIGRPIVDSVVPPVGQPGTLVTIAGTGFGNTQGQGNTGGSGSSVTIGGVPAQVVSWSDTKIVAIVPPGASSGAVVVTTGQGASNGNKTFTLVYPTWYLAEGTTAWGFSTYITIENPNPVTVTARVQYMDPQPEGSGTGRVYPPRDIKLPPQSQTTVDPRWDLGDVDFCTKVTCLQGLTIAVDRTMYWTGKNSTTPEAHSSVGTTLPSTGWFLPEGCSDFSFETWTLIENPGKSPAHVELTYMTETAGPKTVSKTVPAFSRATYNMESDIGRANASIEVASDTPVIAERSMYRNDRREGSCSVGTTAPANDFYLAEGSTAWGFTTWVLIQNPTTTPSDVTITYMTPQGAKAQPSFTLPGNSRKTI